MLRFIFWIYFFVLMPVTWTFLILLKPLWSSKLKKMILERGADFPKFEKNAIWIHASSGEIEYAKPVISLIRKKLPGQIILLTYYSPSIHALIKNLPVDLIVPLPFDLPWKVSAFLSHFQPSLGLFTRSDVWPGFAHKAQQMGIPLLLFSASVSEKSSRLKGITRFLFLYSLLKLNKVSCVSPEDLKLFKVLAQELPQPFPIGVEGDTRFDQVTDRAEKVSSLDFQFSKKVFTLGSTWVEDENFLFPLIQKYTGEFQFVIAPHELKTSHLKNIKDYFQEARLSVILHSEILQTPEKIITENIILIDEIGVLFEYYKKSHLAFVGGSFKEKVHSVMEPLSCGLPVLVGPYIDNNREALHFQKVKIDQFSIVNKISSPEDFQAWLQFWKNRDFDLYQQKIKDEVRSKTGASLKILEWIVNNLPKKR